MEVGLHALGIGTGAERTVVDAVAAAAERAGFATLWVGEHPEVADANDPDVPVADWLDPFVTLSFAAAATNTIELATGVLALPERNPAVVARQAASLHKLSGGRLSLGVGASGARTDYAELDAPFERRGAWLTEYVAALRRRWNAGVGAGFARLHSGPYPSERSIPVVLGCSNEGALRLVAEWGDGWYGHGLRDVEDAAVCSSTLRRLCREAGRDRGDLRLAVSLRDPQPGDLRRLADAGIDQLVLAATPPADPIAAELWVSELARRWLGAAA